MELHFFLIVSGRPDMRFGIASNFVQAMELYRLSSFLHQVRPHKYLALSLHSTDGRLSGVVAFRDCFRVIAGVFE